MSFTVFVAEAAVQELEDAYEWFVSVSIDGAVWYNEILDAINSLDTMPARYPLVHNRDAFDENTRQLKVGDKRFAYLIIFEIRGDRVIVLHVRNAAREDRSLDA
jgi:hypothetical protein